jgi:hypothetical protein
LEYDDFDFENGKVAIGTLLIQEAATALASDFYWATSITFSDTDIIAVPHLLEIRPQLHKICRAAPQTDGKAACCLTVSFHLNR